MTLKDMTENDVAHFAQLPTHVPSMDLIIREHLLLDDVTGHAEFYVVSYNADTREMYGFEIPGTDTPGEWNYCMVDGWIARDHTIKRDMDWKPIRAYEVAAIRDALREISHWP